MLREVLSVLEHLLAYATHFFRFGSVHLGLLSYLIGPGGSIFDIKGDQKCGSWHKSVVALGVPNGCRESDSV